MTINEFKLDPATNPSSGGINLYLDDGYIVKALKVDLNTNSGTSVLTSLSELTSIRITVEQLLDSVLTTTQYKFSIQSRELMDGYYFYTIEPPGVDVQGDINQGQVVNVELTPSPSDANFTKSEYQATQNNASSNRTVGFIYDVDRTTSQILPINYQSIMSSSATPAQYQELNYSSKGLRNSRYDGAKTNINQYGIHSALGLQVFDAVPFGAEVPNEYICSQSLSNLTTETFGFLINSVSPDMPTNIIDIPPTQEYPSSITGSNTSTGYCASSSLAVEPTDTEFTVQDPNHVIQQGDVLVLRTSATVNITTEEYIEVTEITSKTAKFNPTIFNARRGLLGKSKQVAGGTSVKAYFYKVKSDTVYRFTGNKISKLSRKKLYVPDTGEILLISPFGRVVRVEKKCGI